MGSRRSLRRLRPRRRRHHRRRRGVRGGSRRRRRELPLRPPRLRRRGRASSGGRAFSADEKGGATPEVVARTSNGRFAMTNSISNVLNNASENVEYKCFKCGPATLYEACFNTLGIQYHSRSSIIEEYYRGYYQAKGRGKEALLAYVEVFGEPPSKGGAAFHPRKG